MKLLNLDPVEYISKKQTAAIENETTKLIIQKYDLAPEKRALEEFIASIVK